jgi:hypothetical protein
MVTCEALKPGESTQLAAVSVASLASAPKFRPSMKIKLSSPGSSCKLVVLDASEG